MATTGGGRREPLPLPLLASGDQFHLPMHSIVGTAHFVRVTLTWRDKRRGVQERKTTLSLLVLGATRPGSGGQHDFLSLGQHDHERARHRHVIFVSHPDAAIATRHLGTAQWIEEDARVVKFPDSPKTSLQQGLTTRARERWPDLTEVVLRHRGAFSYVDGVLTDGTTLRLCRLRYLGSAHSWGFAIYRASHDDYDESYFPPGLPTGTREDALDTACGLYLGDPTAWT